jgi:C-terminal processing protease CtpA/Prc
VRGVIFHKKENLQSKRLNQRKNIQDWGENLGKHYVEEGFPAVEELEVKEEFGFVIEKKEGDIRIIDISPSSAAAAVHIFPGDILYAVNAQKVKFKSLDTIHRMILDTLIGDCRVTIERKVVILRDSIYFFQSPFSYIDAKVKKGNKSFFVTEVKEEGRAHLAGLRKNDRIVYVEGEPSSFMTLDSFQKKLMGVKGSRLVLVVRRDLQLIRREIS